MNKVDTNSEQHRRECEARHVLKMPDDQREAYYHDVQKHRGRAGVDYLIEEVKRQRRLEKSKDMSI